jgi:hypothetical protein
LIEFEVSTTAENHVAFFWVVTLFTLIGERFAETCCVFASVYVTLAAYRSEDVWQQHENERKVAKL